MCNFHAHQTHKRFIFVLGDEETLRAAAFKKVMIVTFFFSLSKLVGQLDGICNNKERHVIKRSCATKIVISDLINLGKHSYLVGLMQDLPLVKMVAPPVVLPGPLVSILCFEVSVVSQQCLSSVSVVSQ